MADHFGESLFEKWHFQFPFSHLPLEGRGQDINSPEPRLDELFRRMPMAGCRVLELGSLEGWHAAVIASRGAAHVLAVEGRKESFLKCLVVKNAFGLDRCTFLCADVRELLPKLQGHYDLCVALGLLYHLPDPVQAVYRIAELCDAFFCWTHYAGPEHASLGRIQHRGKEYRGAYIPEDTRQYLSGLQDTSFWLHEQDLLQLVRDAGFGDVEVVSKEKAQNGPAITLFCRKQRR